ncbi:helix-turn-helix domain-containing protein [Xenorhabdus bovienii]|nr:helix-turn-helix domain-containing protein [Xenorhabdus bovienii]
MITYLKLAEKTAYRIASEGKLSSFKVNSSWHFKRGDLKL